MIKRHDLYLDVTFGLKPILLIAAMNVVFVLLNFIIACSVFSSPARMEVRMPDFDAVQNAQAEIASIKITGENVLYFNKKVVTLIELQRLLSGVGSKAVVEIYVDRKASMGRMTEVLELCRKLNSSSVKIASY